MDLQFKKIICPCLDWTVRQTRTQEQTQQIRLQDDQPDAGRILACWGQCMLRSKQWQDSGMTVSGGVMCWTLYEPEDGTDPACAQVWLPFQMKWDFTPSTSDGKIQVSCFVRNVDARVISSRKLMVRAEVGVLGEAIEQKDMCFYQPEALDEDVQLLRRTYPVDLPREAGEKMFSVEEDLTMPASCPAIGRLISYELKPELADQKVVGERLVFRGSSTLHVVYATEEGRIQCWDFEVPFSQFADLHREYGPDTAVRFVFAVTGLELEAGETLHLQCGLVAQYVVRSREMIELVEDAYSLTRQVGLQQEKVMIPAALECRKEVIHGEQNLAEATGLVADASYLPDFPEVIRGGEEATVQLRGNVQVLYYDSSDQLQCQSVPVAESTTLQADPAAAVSAAAAVSGRPMAMGGGSGIVVKEDTALEISTEATEGMIQVVGLELGEIQDPDPDRPSLILKRAGEEDLWHLAKACGSTVEAIRKANHLEEEPEEERLLLIPVP